MIMIMIYNDNDNDLWKLCNISDEGYGNFNLFSDKQLKAEIESSSRDSDLENSLTIEVI